MAQTPLTCTIGERAPLLQQTQDARSSKIPWSQLAILCYARAIEGWLFFTIFPYIAQMVEDTGVPHDQIGYYAGIIESVFSVTQVIFMQLVWRKAADNYGRKPVLVFTLAGLSVSAFTFGFSKTVWQMVASRAIGGCFSGYLVIVRLMFSEISTPETRGQIFGFFSLMVSVSSSLAPLAGGLLAKPAEHYKFFQDWQIFVSYPYLLPTLFAGFLAAGASCMAALFLKETRTFKPEQAQELPSTLALLRTPGLSTVLMLNTWFSFIGFAWLTISPIYWYTRVNLGGLGLTSTNISVLMAASGITQASLSVILSPILQSRFGTEGVLWTAAFSFALNFGLQPCLNYIRRHHSSAMFLGTMAANIVLVYGQSLAFFGLPLAQMDVSPSPEALGSVIALFLSNNLAVRAITPSLATSTYAFGVHKHIASGQFAWIIMLVLAVGLCVYMRQYPGTVETKEAEAPSDNGLDGSHTTVDRQIRVL